MHELTVERFLHVTHALRLQDGVVEPLHHHRWRVSVQVSSDRLDAMGAVVDFNELVTLVDAAIADLDGKSLNDHPAFRDRNSSSEHVAEYLAGKVAPHLHGGVALDSVSLFRDEATQVRFTYRPGPRIK